MKLTKGLSDTSYKSPEPQLPGAGRVRVWHYFGGTTPTCRKKHIFGPRENTLFTANGRAAPMILPRLCSSGTW